jgi:hypothetical protein
LSFYVLFLDDAWLHAVRLRARRALPPRLRPAGGAMAVARCAEKP